MSSPTSRTLAYLKEKKWTYQTVERWNPFAKRRIDLFGVVDIVVLTDYNKILGLQVTSPAAHSARIKKSYAEPRLIEWLRCGGEFSVWSWKKLAKRTYADKRVPGLKKFTCRVTKFELVNGQLKVTGKKYDGREDCHLDRIINNKGKVNEQ